MRSPQEIEFSFVKKYKKAIWHRFIKAGREYGLVCDGDRIVCVIRNRIQGFLFAKCYDRLHRYSETKFDICFLADDTQENREYADIFGLCDVRFEGADSYFDIARSEGYNKAALPDCFDDCNEHILSGVLYDGRLGALLPKEETGGITLIRAGILVGRGDILAFARYNGFSQTLDPADDRTDYTRRLINKLRENNQNLEINILRSCEDVNAETVISLIKDGRSYSVLGDTNG
ncbi:MAG: hypothetical protein IJ555_06625 [Ruminococcus sp.]|nr:hypothetical protein [Ruminococcus sp.]MBR1750173.1 hypothetical protein [Ruminococcus sp.]